MMIKKDTNLMITTLYGIKNDYQADYGMITNKNSAISWLVQFMSFREMIGIAIGQSIS